MQESITITFSWKSVIRLSLFWAAEYAMLALIEDAPRLVKAATLICSVGGLAILQFEENIRSFDLRIFRAVVVITGIAYLSFVAYALNSFNNHLIAQNKMTEVYSEAGRLIDRELAAEQAPGADPATPFLRLKDSGVVGFVADAKSWEDRTAKLLLDNLGPAARERFFDMSIVGSNCQGLPRVSVCDNRYSFAKNRLIAEKKNLSAIRETTVYDQY